MKFNVIYTNNETDDRLGKPLPTPVTLDTLDELLAFVAKACREDEDCRGVVLFKGLKDQGWYLEIYNDYRE